VTVRISKRKDSQPLQPEIRRHQENREEREKKKRKNRSAVLNVGTLWWRGGKERETSEGGLCEEIRLLCWERRGVRGKNSWGEKGHMPCTRQTSNRRGSRRLWWTLKENVGKPRKKPGGKSGGFLKVRGVGGKKNSQLTSEGKESENTGTSWG